MAYVKSAGGKRYSAEGKKPSFGARGGKPSYAKKSFGSARSSDGPVVRHKAVCSSCGNACDVPFKPVSGKPIFCRDCFVKTGETATNGRAGDRFAKREYTPRVAPAAAPQDSASNAAILKQLEILNAKIERLIAAVQGSAIPPVK